MAKTPEKSGINFSNVMKPGNTEPLSFEEAWAYMKKIQPSLPSIKLDSDEAKEFASSVIAEYEKKAFIDAREYAKKHEAEYYPPGIPTEKLTQDDIGRAFGAARKAGFNLETSQFGKVAKGVSEEMNRRFEDKDYPVGAFPEIDAAIAQAEKDAQAIKDQEQQARLGNKQVNDYEKHVIAAYAREHGMKDGAAKGEMRTKGLIPSKDAGPEQRRAWYQGQMGGEEPQPEAPALEYDEAAMGI